MRERGCGRPTEAPFGIRIRPIRTGDDWTFLITGGAAHIGAVSVAYWPEPEEGRQSNGSGGETAAAPTVRTTVVPGHKEDLLTEPLAREAARRLRRTVTVIAGIHVDGATRADIEAILRFVPAEMVRVLDGLLPEAASAEPSEAGTEELPKSWPSD